MAFTGLFQSKPLKQSVLSIFAAIAVILVLVLEIFSTDQIHGSRMVELLPFLSLLLLAGIRTEKPEGANRRRRSREETSVWGAFVKGNAYLPILALTYLFLAPVLSRYLLHAEQFQERTSIEAKVKGKRKLQIVSMFGMIRQVVIRLANAWLLVSYYHRDCIQDLMQIVPSL